MNEEKTNGKRPLSGKAQVRADDHGERRQPHRQPGSPLLRMPFAAAPASRMPAEEDGGHGAGQCAGDRRRQGLLAAAQLQQPQREQGEAAPKAKVSWPLASRPTAPTHVPEDRPLGQVSPAGPDQAVEEVGRRDTESAPSRRVPISAASGGNSTL